MWCCVDLVGDVVAKFPAGRNGWLEAVRWATRNGGEYDIVLLDHVAWDATLMDGLEDEPPYAA